MKRKFKPEPAGGAAQRRRSAKSLRVVKEHFDHMKVEKEKEGLRFELAKAPIHRRRRARGGDEKAGR